MNLEQTIVELECCLTKVEEISKSEVYKLAISEGHSTLSTDLEDVKHYLQNAIENLEELLDIKFVESLDIDLSKCIPYTEDTYKRATKLTEGMEVDLDEELEGDLW